MKRQCDPVDDSREFKRIKLDLDAVKLRLAEAKETVRAVRKDMHALEAKLDSHAVHQTNEARAERKRLRKTLPSWLYDELAVSGTKAHGILTRYHANLDTTEYPWLRIEIGLTFSRSGEYCFRSEPWHSAVKIFDGVIPGIVVPDAMRRSIWEDALNANRRDVPKALVAVTLAQYRRRLARSNAGKSDLWIRLLGLGLFLRGAEDDEEGDDEYNYDDDDNDESDESIDDDDDDHSLAE